MTSMAINGSLSMEEVQEWLCYRLEQYLSVDGDYIEYDRPFMEYGLDSMGALQIAGEMEQWMGVELDPTVLWEYPTIEKFSMFLIGQYNR